MDAKENHVHLLVPTSANMAESRVLPYLLDGEERKVWGDAGYQGQTGAIQQAAPSELHHSLTERSCDCLSLAHRNRATPRPGTSPAPTREGRTRWGALLLGFGLGSEADVLRYLLALYFGRKHFSVIYGLTWTAYAIGGATDPMFIGHLYDVAGTHHSRFIVYLTLVALAAAAVSLSLRRTVRSGSSAASSILIPSPISLEV